MAWMILAGILFSISNAVLRWMALRQTPSQTMTMQYAMTLLMLSPVVLHVGWRACRPRNVAGVVARGALHWLATIVWLTALPMITLAESTAIQFTSPLFVMAGAALVLKERIGWDRALAAAMGLCGVLVVVSGRLDGGGGLHSLLMLLATMMYAVAHLVSKHLMARDKPGVVVLWQLVVVAICSIPQGLSHWQSPPPGMWWAAAVAAASNVAGQYLMARAFATAELSASQPVTYLTLVWACLLGWLVFDDRLHATTVLGGGIIVLAMVWLARRGARRM